MWGEQRGLNFSFLNKNVEFGLPMKITSEMSVRLIAKVESMGLDL